jgi:excisionase family DNA binding protein
MSNEAAKAAPARRLYSINEVAELLSVTPKHIYAMAYSGELPTVKLGRRRLVPAEVLDTFIAGLGEHSPLAG